MINGFDYGRYLREKKISGIVKLNKIEVLKKEKDFKYYLFNQKEKLFVILEKNYSNEQAGFLKAILLGQTSSLDENIKENFKKANVSHILAISGMHITYIVLALENSLKIFIKNIKTRNFIIIIFLFIFAIFVGESNSVWRACIMNIIAYLGKIILRKDDFYTSFKVAFCILLISNPYNIFSGSMWLSFGGSIGIVLYSKLIEKLVLKKLVNKRKIMNNFEEVIVNKNKFLNNIKKFGYLNLVNKSKEMIFSFSNSNIIQDKNINDNSFFIKFIERNISIISVTLGAQIIIFPMMIYMFNTISFNFFISNLLISELIGPILILGYLSILLPFLSVFEKIIMKLIFFLAQLCANLPFNQILIITPNLYKILIYYLFLAVLAFFYNTRKKSLIKKIKRLKLKVVFVLFSIFILLFGNINFPFRNSFEIHFLDVGQGDCCLVRTKHNKVILIDGGKGLGEEYDYGKNVVGPYLLDHGIKKIDYIIVSHFDSDHCRRFILYCRKF